MLSWDNHFFTDGFQKNYFQSLLSIHRLMLQSRISVPTTKSPFASITSTILFEFDGNRLEIGLIEILRFTEDGHSLSINQSASSEYGNLVNSLIYKKE